MPASERRYDKTKGVPVYKINLRSSLLLGAATAAAIGLSAPAYAQQAMETVVVTGTLIQGNVNLVSPITVIDQTALDQRGISTIQSALQQDVAINGPALTNSFTANGAFAGGASGASLRGLSTNSTLVLFDGMRAAYYPLADDGSRNFVDMNTIPDDIVESVQILRDGASAQYGADAIAGVINIITKKEFQGISGRAEYGVAERGGAGEYKASVTAGVGDLSTDHVNFYVSAFYLQDAGLMNSQRPYPYNSVDGSGITYQGTPGSNGVINGVQSDGSFAGISTAGEFAVRPGTHNADGSFTALAGSKYQNLDGCASGTSYTLTVAQQTATPTAPATVCQYDYAKLGGEIQPAINRFGISTHTAFVLPNGAEGYVETNFMQDNVKYDGFYGEPSTMYGNAPTGIAYPTFSTSSNLLPHAAGSELLYLPVWVCPERVNCSTSANRHLNPNNPFAAAGNDARLIGRDWFGRFPSDESQDRSYRLAAGFDGTFSNDWKYHVGATAMHTDLTTTANGFVYIQHLLDVINDGTYNFVNPAANSKAVLDYVFPTNTNKASSDEDQIVATVTAPLFKLPGGDLTAVVGGSISYEAVDDPSGNPDYNGPTQRYFVLNAFGTKGARRVYSGFFEINAPVFEELVLNASGRFDKYSSGQSNFSPKLGLWYKPFDFLTLKGAYSQGFRIPSFAEANALPTTGYVTNAKSLFNDAYLAQYGCTLATYNTCSTYLTAGSYGETTLASPSLNPEKSRSWVFDVTVHPIDELTLTATYYNIKKTGAITGPDLTPAIQAYYTGQPIPAGYTVIADAPDVAHPAATPRIAFVEAQLINANTVRTSGFDFGMTYDSDLDFLADTFGKVHLTSAANATFIQNLSTVFPDGHVERYDGTLGNFNLTAGTGTPKWRGIWQNTFTSGMWDITATVNWFSGYNLSAMDQGTGYKDCGLDSGNQACNVADAWTYDANIQAHVTSNITAYVTVLNVLDTMPPIDNVTYGAVNYNPVQGGDMILGRYWKFGVKLDY
jgi:iron complex outermembrane receptor protein